MPDETVLLLETLQSSSITTTEIKSWSAHDTVLLRVAERVLSGWSSTTDETLIPYQRQQEELSLEDGCVMWEAVWWCPKLVVSWYCSSFMWTILKCPE